MNSTFRPDSLSQYWIKIDYDSLIANIAQVASSAEIIDLGLPLLRQIWPYIEEDVLRIGIKGLVSQETQVLLSADHAFTRILKPGFQPGDKGYARAGIFPVLSSLQECLALSNLAQGLDQRLPFLVHVRSCDSDTPSGDWNLESICEKIPSLPMVDLAGFYMRFSPQERLLGYFRRLLHNAEAAAYNIICPISLEIAAFDEVSCYFCWESLAMKTDSSACFPLEIGCWAYPVGSGSDYQIFQADIGRLHGLPAKFPILIAGEKAELEKLEDDFCEFVVRKQMTGPFPVQALLTGGSALQAIELPDWQPDDLRNLLLHLGDCPIYLQQKTGMLEILP